MFEGVMKSYTDPTWNTKPVHKSGWTFDTYKIEFADRRGNYNGYAGVVVFKACDWEHALKQAIMYAKKHNLKMVIGEN